MFGFEFISPAFLNVVQMFGDPPRFPCRPKPPPDPEILICSLFPFPSFHSLVFFLRVPLGKVSSFNFGRFFLDSSFFLLSPRFMTGPAPSYLRSNLSTLAIPPLVLFLNQY